MKLWIRQYLFQLYEDLAEHILIELAANFATLNENWPDETVESVKQSALVLMDAAGELISHEDAVGLSIEVLLEKFLTRTEKTKAWGKRRACKPSEKGPITKLSEASPAIQASQLKVFNKLEWAVDEKSNMTTNNQSRELFAETEASRAYLQAKLLINAAGIGDRDETKVGMRLLDKRANKEMQLVSCDELLKLQNQMVTDWNKLREECQHRSLELIKFQCKI